MRDAFQRFLKRNGICHRKGAPYHPATNGQAERYVQTIKTKIEQCLNENDEDIDLLVSRILMRYRNIRTKLDLMLPDLNEDLNKHDTVYQGREREFKIGDRVEAREYIDHKTRWLFGRIHRRLGKVHYEVELDDGQIWTRHVDQIINIGNDIPLNSPDHNVSSPVTIENQVDQTTVDINTESIPVENDLNDELFPSPPDLL